jgi:enamine deaminase RidA (YjgF/YER057c/UK114 family)
MTITHINPATLHKNPAFSQATLVDGGRTLYIGEQNGTDVDGAITGDFGAQTRQALKNVLACLAEVGADQTAVVKLTIYIKHGESVQEGFAASADVWGQNATAITVIPVPALGRPEALVGIEAIASV